jgi:hypothetical protein
MPSRRGNILMDSKNYTNLQFHVARIAVRMIDRDSAYQRARRPASSLHNAREGPGLPDRQALQKAREFAQVPRPGPGGEYINNLNPSSQGPAWYEIKDRQQQYQRPVQNGLRNLHGRNYYAHHPCGHPGPGPPHHKYPHYHACDIHGNERVLTYGQPEVEPARGGFLRATGRVLTGVAIALSVTAVAEAAPGDRLAVAGREAASLAGGFVGGAIGSAVGSVVPVFGSFIGGIIGSAIGAAIANRLAVPERPQPGGVALTGAAIFLSAFEFSLPSLDSFDLDDGCLVLLSAAGNTTTVSGVGRSISGDDFLIALAVASFSIDPAFSLDPWNPQAPSASDFQKVFYPDMLRGTAFGETLFQTDYDMKKLGFGIIAKPLAPGFQNELDILLQSSGHLQGCEGGENA